VDFPRIHRRGIIVAGLVTIAFFVLVLGWLFSKAARAEQPVIGGLLALLAWGGVALIRVFRNPRALSLSLSDAEISQPFVPGAPSLRWSEVADFRPDRLGVFRLWDLDGEAKIEVALDRPHVARLIREICERSPGLRLPLPLLSTPARWQFYAELLVGFAMALVVPLIGFRSFGRSPLLHLVMVSGWLFVCFHYFGQTRRSPRELRIDAEGIHLRLRSGIDSIRLADILDVEFLRRKDGLNFRVTGAKNTLILPDFGGRFSFRLYATLLDLVRQQSGNE